ncbi:type II secretion system F family protein [Streptomyces sp. CBMA291]|uniref:type II secretion system F family protein n=1 Tax=unclassified Streptomyces TaxID=2593676 RepID=UPI001DED64D5|nr:type II secretion protein F [Streptomyces sp. CBMA291]MBD0717906.1 type II secretion protein F [Streptomyces sp. CBMA370]
MSEVVRLGALLAVVSIGCARGVREAVAGRRSRGTRRRLRGLFPEVRPAGPKAGNGLPEWVWHGGAAFGTAVLGWVLFGVLGGLAAGALAGVGARRWFTGRGTGRAEGEAMVRDLPLAADLLAACASAGAGPGEAAEAVGRSLGGPLGERLSRTAAELRLGGEPAEVWGRFGEIPGAEGLARCMERAGSSGAPAAEAVARHAIALRSAGTRAAAARARKAQVLISAPVGLCFLPAFLAVGVAPVVIGLAMGLLKG